VLAGAWSREAATQRKMTGRRVWFMGVERLFFILFFIFYKHTQGHVEVSFDECRLSSKDKLRGLDTLPNTPRLG